MGFGQHMKVDDVQKEAGYPVSRTKVKTGRMTMDEIMVGVDISAIVKTEKSAHNEVTLTYAGGTVVCRLRETDIVTLGANKVILIDTGGWNTVTTRRHVVNFLERHGFQISLWGDKKRGGNVLTRYGSENSRLEISFRQRIMFNQVGGFLSDLDSENFDLERSRSL